MAGIALVRLGADIEATEQYGLTPIAAAVSAGHRPMAKTLEDEACRSADFNHRENIELAYRIAGPAPIQDLPDDVDEVPPVRAYSAKGWTNVFGHFVFKYFSRLTDTTLCRVFIMSYVICLFCASL
jgi:hypothetical protein